MFPVLIGGARGRPLKGLIFGAKNTLVPAALGSFVESELY